jgi:hypothetical protein
MSKYSFHYALTIFLSAFLLFQVQPLIGKYILPWFGGNPAVWTTCLLFFQVGLLAGYGYAHWIASWRAQQYQGLVHLLLLGGALLLLPIVPNNAWKPSGTESPTWLIMGLLAVTVGAHYFLLSTTGPLLQAWYSKIYPNRSPYRLYALSNAGSLLGLLTYPCLFEPLLTRRMQALAWSVAYIAFALGSGWCAWQMLRSALRSRIATAASNKRSDFGLKLNCSNADTFSLHQTSMNDPHDKSNSRRSIRKNLDRNSQSENDLSNPASTSPVPRVIDVLSWLVLAFCGSVLLVATTNQLCQGVAVIPFLWVLPLSLYLITFIIAFEGRNLYRRMWCIPLLAVTSFLACWVLHRGEEVPLVQQILVYSSTFFAACMTCHGELARAKPSPKYLTLFFLTVAAGGALGGIFVALAAPVLFTGYWEYHLALAGAGALALAVMFFDSRSPLYQGKPLWVWVLSLSIYTGLIAALLSSVVWDTSDTLAASRSFFGVLRVTEFEDQDRGVYRELLHGGIVHGFQYTGTRWRGMPTSYYGEGTGAWLAINNHPQRLARKPMHIGIVGLGTGTMAIFGRKGDTIKFYEIDPNVIDLSGEWFWYRQDSQAAVEIVLGDARIQLERELAQGHGQQFDLLVVDAFSGSAIPLHLLTQECAQVYRRHLKDSGILALHISNQSLDLIPVALGLAQTLNWEAIVIDSDEDLNKATWDATWVLITANRTFLDSPAAQKARTKWGADSSTSLIWTDDYTSLLHVLN